MFKLTEDELENAYQSIEHHGYSTLFPPPPEWNVIKLHWTELKKLLAAEDLDSFTPTIPLRVFAPKNRYNLRVVTHLHPIDLIIYTALVLLIRDDIESVRIPKRKKTVFSFRSDPSSRIKLYEAKRAFGNYRDELRRRSSAGSCRYVAVADIADFYPRVYQHRLENIVATVASSTRNEEVARVLVRKFIFNIAEGTSYGIPIGPYASRILAEALLTDVDDALIVSGIAYVRWVDDFSFFCKTDAEAQHALFFLARWLFEKHGLTLHGGKTKIVTVAEFREKYLTTHEDKLAARAEVLRDLWGTISPYEDEEEEIGESELEELEKTNFVEMLEQAIDDKELVDYEMVSFILGRLSSIDEFKDEWRIPLVGIILSNIIHLYPVIDSVSRFFLSFHHLDTATRKKIAGALLKPILGRDRYAPPDYYAMWVLSVFMSDRRWNNADKIMNIFQSTHSEVVRRYAAHALAITGNRTHALSVRDYYAKSSPLVKLAILSASKLLGDDERKFWKRSSLISGHLEKRI